MVTKREKGQGKDKLGVWDYQIQSDPCIEWINKVLLYSTGDYIPYPRIKYYEKTLKTKKTSYVIHFDKLV